MAPWMTPSRLIQARDDSVPTHPREMPKRHAFRRCLVLLFLCLAAACSGERKSVERPSDFVLITVDTLRADALGYAGNAQVKTPAIDSLAARGVVFTRAHAHNVVTLPSHANILTGLLPYEHGIRDNAGFTLDPSKPTIAGMMREAGFATGAFVSAFPLDRKFGLTTGFDEYDDRYPAALNALDFAIQERSGTATLAAASKWWQANSGRPRFLWVHLYEPHAPYIPPQPFRDAHKDNLYLGEVAAVDSMIGVFLDPLLAASPRTMVVLTADHGESLGDHGELTHGLFAYEPTLHVPLIVLDPDHEPARDERPVGHIDIAPTITSRAGIAPNEAWKGKSLFASGDRAPTYFEAISASLNRGWAPLVGVISGPKKLIDLPIPELYDLVADPKETSNKYAEDRRTSFALRKILAEGAPAKTAAARQEVSAEEQSKLLALGYVSGHAAKASYTTADDPKNLVALDNKLHRAIAAYQNGNLKQAMELMRELVAARPDMEIGHEMFAFFLQQNEKPDEAIVVLQRNVATGRASEATKVRLGLMLSENGRAQEAVDVLGPLASKEDPDVLNAYGIALADLGDVPGAVREFERILAKDPEEARAYQNLGIVALRAGQPQRARQYLQKALTLDANLPLALNALGVIQARAGDAHGAIASWSRVVELDPNQLDALYNLALVAVKAKRPDVARRALTSYLERAPASKYAAERKRAADLLRGL